MGAKVASGKRGKVAHSRADLVLEPTPEKLALDELWNEFKSTNAATARDRLIVHYAPLVKYVAGRVSTGLPSNIDQEDLVSYGIFGLIDAITKFELGRHVKFETYAISRIKGAIIDELRSIDWVPRSVRAKARDVERTLNKLENELRRTPTDAEVAAQMEISVQDLQSIYTQVSFVSVVALDELMSVGSERGDKVALIETLEDIGDVGPEQAFEKDEMKQILGQAIGRLSDREQKLIVCYYYEGLTLAQIGEILGVTESRVCQMHTKAVMQLRARLKEANTD